MASKIRVLDIGKFTINIDYRLASKDGGIIYVGFNTSSVNSYSLADSVEVPRATGSKTMSATVVPVDYPAPGDFRAFANLSEYPHPAQWAPLAGHSYRISVTQAGKSDSAAHSEESDYFCQRQPSGTEQCGR